MTSKNFQTEPFIDEQQLSNRRKFLAKAAAATVVGLAVPTIITVEPASAAELQSPPPQPANGTELTPPATQSKESKTLAFTGDNIADETVNALGIIGSGAVLVWSSKHNQNVVHPSTEEQ